MKNRNGQINNARHTIRVVNADFVTGQSRNFYRPNHSVKVPL